MSSVTVGEGYDHNGQTHLLVDGSENRAHGEVQGCDLKRVQAQAQAQVEARAHAEARTLAEALDSDELRALNVALVHENTAIEHDMPTIGTPTPSATEDAGASETHEADAIYQGSMSMEAMEPDPMADTDEGDADSPLDFVEDEEESDSEAKTDSEVLGSTAAGKKPALKSIGTSKKPSKLANTLMKLSKGVSRFYVPFCQPSCTTCCVFSNLNGFVLSPVTKNWSTKQALRVAKPAASNLACNVNVIMARNMHRTQ